MPQNVTSMESCLAVSCLAHPAAVSHTLITSYLPVQASVQVSTNVSMERRTFLYKQKNSEYFRYKDVKIIVVNVLW